MNSFTDWKHWKDERDFYKKRKKNIFADGTSWIPDLGVIVRLVKVFEFSPAEPK